MWRRCLVWTVRRIQASHNSLKPSTNTKNIIRYYKLFLSCPLLLFLLCPSKMMIILPPNSWEFPMSHVNPKKFSTSSSHPLSCFWKFSLLRLWWSTRWTFFKVWLYSLCNRHCSAGGCREGSFLDSTRTLLLTVVFPVFLFITITFSVDACPVLTSETFFRDNFLRHSLSQYLLQFVIWSLLGC